MIRTQQNKIKNRKVIESINKTKSCFFATSNKTDKILAKLTNKIRQKKQINKTN